MRPRSRLPAWLWLDPRLVQVLDPAHGMASAPIRAEIFGLERFAQHGISLGQTHRAAKAGFGQATFYPRLRSRGLAHKQGGRGDLYALTRIDVPATTTAQEQALYRSLAEAAGAAVAPPA